MSITDDLLTLLMGKVNGEGGGDKPLTPLTNPALAENILAGKEAYNDQKEVLTGSLTVADLLAALTNPAAVGDLLAGKEAYNDQGVKLVGSLTVADLLAALNTPASAGDIAAGKEAYDDQGQRIVGTAAAGDTLTQFINGTLETYRNDALTRLPPYALAYGKYLKQSGSSDNWVLGIKNLILTECTSIGDYGAAENKAIETLQLPKVDSIGIAAFINCPKLQTLNFPLLTRVEDDAFNCYTAGSREKTLTAPLLTFVGAGAFKGANLSAQSIIGALETVGEYAFSECSHLVNISFSSTVNVSIDQYAFNQCRSLVLPADWSKVVSVGLYAFSECSGFAGQSLRLPAATYIGINAFNKTGLKRLSFPAVTTYEGPQSTGALEELCLNYKKAAIRGSIIEEQTTLKRLILPQGNVEPGSVQFTALEALSETGKTGSQTISNTFFRYMSALKYVKLTDLDNINSSGLSPYGLFSQVPNLEAVLLPGEKVVAAGGSTAAWFPENCTFYVNDDYYDQYLVATNWSTITSRIKKLSECPQAIVDVLSEF